jgi:uncharacterized protein (TIGR02594 family)
MPPAEAAFSIGGAMKRTVMALVFAAATAPPDAHATEIPTEAAFERPFSFGELRMPNLPAQYAWLGRELAPNHLVQALKLFGTVETPGAKSNPVILAWADEVGVDDVYVADSVPWCGLFAAVVMKRAGWEPVKNPLWALNWSKYGQKADKPMLGDVLTFTRNGGGHVGFYVGEDASCFHVLGGNQSDQVCITRIAKNRLHAARRPEWRIAQPTNVRSIRLAAAGGISQNEA